MNIPSYDTDALYSDLGESRILPQESWDDAFAACCIGPGTQSAGALNLLINFEGAEVLKRRMMRDPVIFGIDQIYRALVCEGEHLIVGCIQKPGPSATPAEKRLYKLSEEALVFTQGWAGRLPYALKALCHDLLEAKSFGHKLAESEFGDYTHDQKPFKGQTYVAPIDIAPKPRTVYRFKVTKANRVLGAVVGSEDTFIPAANLVVHTIGGMDRDPRGTGVLPSLWGAYQSRQRARLNQDKASDQTGGGFLVVTDKYPPQSDGAIISNTIEVPDGVDEFGNPKTKQVSRQAIASAAMAKASTGKTAALPPGMDVKVVQASGAEIFASIMDGDNRDIATVYLGNASIAFEAKRDSQSAAGKAENVGETLRDAARGHLSETIRSLFATVLSLNFGDKYRDVVPRYDIVTEEGTDMGAVSNFFQANFDKLNDDQKNWLASKIGMPLFPESTEDEETTAIQEEEDAKTEEEVAQFVASFGDPSKANFANKKTVIANGAAQKRLDGVARSATRQLRSLVASLEKGTRAGKPFGPDEFADRFAGILSVGHSRALELGWAHGLGAEELSEDAEVYLLETLTQESEFARELADGLADGTKSTAQANLAAKRYASRMGGTANEAFRQASVGSGFTIDWDLNGSVERHCVECPGYAKMSPWQPEELFAVPRGGSTPCFQECKCKLKRSDGRDGFGPVSI